MMWPQRSAIRRATWDY